MKALFKWNFYFVLLMMCSVPLFMGCGDDDDNGNDLPGGPTETVYLGWEDDGNKATFGFKASVGGISVSAKYTLTFNGPGKEAVCTKCVLDETYPNEAYAQAAEQSYKTEQDYYISIKRNGKTVTLETDEYTGMTREDIQIILELAFPPK